MKKILPLLVVLTLSLTQACAPAPATQTALGSATQVPAESEAASSSPIPPTATETETGSIVMEISTTLPSNGSGNNESPTSPPASEEGFFSGDITRADAGRTIILRVGDSFLLNLGSDQYTWTVTVDNDSVLRMKMGVLVINGAQGIFEGLAPGTATLTATGDPLCLQSTPPCAMPSILFTLYVEVK